MRDYQIGEYENSRHSFNVVPTNPQKWKDNYLLITTRKNGFLPALPEVLSQQEVAAAMPLRLSRV
jgi:hypothetical protein